ncbi:MAG: TetR/AcrR family transcriptional regulator [Chloroflexi bacterium]|nr:TetR/AcrR family transcriptional regulator [Chloroflexota bacterium]MYC01564.1 TetR/AcrR family transcriptional regulator [Chloroflexota bacterium]
MSGSGESRRPGDLDETTRKLLDAAAAAFVEHGYERAAVSDIARRAGVTTGAVYPRWPRKDDLMADAVDHIFHQILPEQRLEELGLDRLPAFNLISMWSALLLRQDPAQELLVQAFASARTNETVHERLKRYLDTRGDQVERIVERARSEASNDPGFNTQAITMMIQAVAIGMVFILSADLDERHMPPHEEWVRLNEAMLNVAFPQA